MSREEVEAELRTLPGVGKLEAFDAIKAADENTHRFQDSIDTIRFRHGEAQAEERKRELSREYRLT